MSVLEQIDIERLSPQSRWALTHLALPKHDEGEHGEGELDDAELARRNGLKPRKVKRMLDELYAEIRAQRLGAVVPELGKRERETLKESLLRHGQLVPILVDQHGNVLDGDNRLALLDELGIEPRYETVVVDGEEDAREKGLTVNLTRRQLDGRKLRHIAAAEILHDPSRSDRAIAELLGVHKNTVNRARQDLLRLGMVAHGATVIGKDGVAQRRREAPDRQLDLEARESLVGRTIVSYVVDVEESGKEHTTITLDDGRSYELLEVAS